MAVTLQYGRRLAGQTLRMTVGKTYSSGFASKGSPFISYFPNKLTISIDNPSKSFSNSSSNNSPRKDLMDYPRITPHMLNGVISFWKSLFFERYIIARYDRDFTLETFKLGAKGAFLAVSEILASDDVAPLKEHGLVEASAFREIKANHDRMDTPQRRQFLVSERHIRVTHVHEIGIIEDDESGLKAVEIMVVFTVLPSDDDQLSFQEAIQKVILCNYRFYRDYSNPSNPSPWIVNIVNHFRPGERLED